jgi:hypothetical protein
MIVSVSGGTIGIVIGSTKAPDEQLTFDTMPVSADRGVSPRSGHGTRPPHLSKASGFATQRYRGGTAEIPMRDRNKSALD